MAHHLIILDVNPILGQSTAHALITKKDGKEPTGLGIIPYVEGMDSKTKNNIKIFIARIVLFVYYVPGFSYRLLARSTKLNQ